MVVKINPTWEDVLSAAARLQGIVRDAVLVGGTASAVFAAHRVSHDADHIVYNLRENFDKILADLESVAGWKTARITPPVLILGSLDGIETSIRQLIRKEPLETEQVSIRGQSVTVPTPQEILRIKSALILKRNAMRDYVDFAALSHSLGTFETSGAFRRFDILYPQQNGESATQQLIVQLVKPSPHDFNKRDLNDMSQLSSQWKSWDAVVKQCQESSMMLMNKYEILKKLDKKSENANESVSNVSHQKDSGCTR